MGIAELAGPRGEAALAAARRLLGLDPLRALTTLRGEYGEALAAAAWTQAGLRSRGVEKFGEDAWSMLFTAAGLEQSTRAPVAEHRAGRFAGLLSVADLGCGIGGDLRALVAAVPTVLGVDLDAETAACAAHNAPAARVEVGDALSVDLAGFDAAFVDPARRTARGRVFRPADYTPPWEWVRSLLVTRTAVAKVAPGIPHELVPAGVEAEWVSWNGEVKEAVLWSGSLATPGVGRRATLLTLAPPRGATSSRSVEGTAPPGGASVSQPATLVGTGASAEAGPLGRWLHEPDGAVIRAGLVAEAAATVDGHLLDPSIAYVTTDADVLSPYSRRWEVLEALPFQLKRLRAALRARDVGRVDVKKRGSAIEPDALRRQLRLTGEEHAVVVLTRVDGQPWALICEPPGSD